MSLAIEAKRTNAGLLIIRHQEQIDGLIRRLTVEKTNMIQLKGTVNADADFTAAEKAEVAAVLASSKTKLVTVIGNLDK